MGGVCGDDLSPLSLRWKRMPKHIKVCKHPETRKFYVSDVCEFLSVAVSHNGCTIISRVK